MNPLTKIRDKAATKKKIAAIHNEFFTAADKLVAEAKKIIGAGEAKSKSKGDRLAALGFSQNPEFIQARKDKEKANDYKASVQYAEYFGQHYPLHKFITERQVKEICEKYGLVKGEASKFRGFVPEKNLKEMESFKLREEDKSERTVGGGLHLPAIAREPRFISRRGRFGEISYEMDWSDADMLMGTWSEGRTERFTPPFEICGPVKDFDTRYMEIKDGYKLQHVPDPVVLQPVKGGYLIVTAWGDEASDDNVVNAVHN